LPIRSTSFPDRPAAGLQIDKQAERWYTASDKDTGKECRESCWKS
jgi:hypothetical protein